MFDLLRRFRATGSGGLATCLLGAAIAGPTQPASAAAIFDQQRLGPVTTSTSFMLFSLAQSFTPTFTTLAFVDAGVGCCDPSIPGPVTLRIDIRDGGIAGPVVASSSTVVLPHASGSVMTRFEISPPLATTPGGTYVMQLVHVSGGNGAWSVGGNAYPGGTAILDGVTRPDSDRVFRTGVLSDEPPQAGGGNVPVEYSNDLDEQALAGGGQGPMDPGQILYTEPPDDAANNLPQDTTDFSPFIESGDEPDAQVDALADGLDYLYWELVHNTADLVVSFEGDTISGGPSPEVAAMREGLLGLPSLLYTHADLDTSDTLGVVEDVDGIELWGPLGADDAFYFSRENDALSGTSVYVDIGGAIGTFITHAQIVSAVVALGYTGDGADVDLDALMVRNVGAQVEFETGDEILFSIRAVPQANFDGGEIIRLPIGGTPSFLEHGAHTWDTAFGVATAFGSASEDVDGLEAFPSPHTIPTLSPAGLLVFAAGLLGFIGYYRRRF